MPPPADPIDTPDRINLVAPIERDRSEDRGRIKRG